MLSIPDQSVHRVKVADWLEFKAICSPDSRIGFSTLLSATALSEDEQEKDVADEDQAQDEFVIDVQNEISRRHNTVGADYPFRIDEKGRVLEFKEPLTKTGAVYLFCLFLSHAFDRTILPKKIAPRVTNRIRDLFQACATVAAGGFVGGPAISFGFPRPDGTTFLKALHRVYELFGDGKPRKKPRPAAAKRIKDNGIDVIAWRRSADGLPCTLYMIGQVASGNDWTDKSVTTDREHFHKYWFDEEPGSQAQDAMFIPLGLEAEEPVDGTDYETVLKDHMQSIAYRYGILFYRDRIARYLNEGLAVAGAGETDIERIEDLKKIEKWVADYMGKLRKAA